MNLIIYVEMT